MSRVRVQLSRRKGWRMPPNTVRVARPSRWGNPFVISSKFSRELAIDLFRDLTIGFFSPSKLAHLTDAEFAQVYDARDRWIKQSGWGLELRSGIISELRGKNLACWCPLVDEHGNHVPCHADVLLELANA